MNNNTLSQIDEVDLINSYRVIVRVMNDLQNVEDGILDESIGEEIKNAYQRVRTELEQRGYSQEELADIASARLR